MAPMLADSSATVGEDIHRQPLAELYRRLDSASAGLGGDDATARLARHGPNALRVRKDTPEIVKLLLHARSITFQLAEVTVSRRLWEEMLTAIAGLRPIEQLP